MPSHLPISMLQYQPVMTINPIAMVPTNFFDDSCDVKTVLQVHSIISHTSGIFQPGLLPRKTPISQS
jgi:hypothetical protein